MVGGYRWRRTIAIAVTAALFLFVWWAYIRRPTQPDPIQAPPSQPPPISNATTQRWTETKRKLRSLLREPWARANTGINDPEAIDDHELLNAFARLFKRPDISQLPDSDSLSNFMGTEFDDHPFTGFLHRLPVDVPSTTKTPGNGEGGRRCLEFLAKMALLLKKSEIQLDTDTPRDLAQSARLASIIVSFSKLGERGEVSRKPRITGASGKKGILITDGFQACDRSSRRTTHFTMLQPKGTRMAVASAEVDS